MIELIRRTGNNDTQIRIGTHPRARHVYRQRRLRKYAEEPRGKRTNVRDNGQQEQQHEATVSSTPSASAPPSSQRDTQGQDEQDVNQEFQQSLVIKQSGRELSVFDLGR